MEPASEHRAYLDIDELSARTGMSLATINRLKRVGKIVFYQPAGKGGRVLFPPDAIERAGSSPNGTPEPPAVDDTKKHLAGPRPAWMQGGKSPN
jgi:hypothetical protein